MCECKCIRSCLSSRVEWRILMMYIWRHLHSRMLEVVFMIVVLQCCCCMCIWIFALINAGVREHFNECNVLQWSGKNADAHHSLKNCVYGSLEGKCIYTYAFVQVLLLCVLAMVGRCVRVFACVRVCIRESVRVSASVWACVRACLWVWATFANTVWPNHSNDTDNKNNKNWKTARRTSSKPTATITTTTTTNDNNHNTKHQQKQQQQQQPQTTTNITIITAQKNNIYWQSFTTLTRR